MQTSPLDLEVAARTDAALLAEALTANVTRVVRGKPEAARLAIGALLAGGHLLIEDVPGVGKTLLAKALARSIGGSFRRVQGTPDLLPAELTGVEVWQPATGAWDFRAGPLFADVVLVDEINRTTPRTQSALLEAMEERQVTVDGTTHRLPETFFVVATQNPFEHVGTFPLVEGQRDRFSVVVTLGVPDRPTERALLLGHGGDDELDALAPVTDAAGLRRAQRTVRSVHCDPAVADYVVDVVDASRSHPDVVIGASPRASIALLRVAQARALLGGRGFVTPTDVKAIAVAALAHRLILRDRPDLDSAIAVVESILASRQVPRG